MWQKKWINKVTKSKVLNEGSLALIWVGFLKVRFAVVRGGGGIIRKNKYRKIQFVLSLIRKNNYRKNLSRIN